MLPLCGELGVSVNELLAGRRVEETEYKEQAEANMMDLVRQNQENKKRMALSVICGSVTVVAVVLAARHSVCLYGDNCLCYNNHSLQS